MRLLKYYILSILVSTIGCTKDKKGIVTNEVYITKNVMIYGVTDDPIEPRFITFMDHSYFFGKAYADIEKRKSNDSIEIKLKSIESPLVMRSIISTKNNLYDTTVFIEPGDTLKFEIKNKKIQFYGKKGTLNNFYSNLQEETPLYRENAYKGNIREYKKQLKYIYDSKIMFLNKYIANHNITSKYFENYVKEDLKLRYFHELINPRNLKVKDKNIFYGEIDGIESLVQQEYATKEEIFDYSTYFNEIHLETYKNPELLLNGNFKSALNLYVRHHFVSSEHPNYSKEKLIEEKDFIEQNFEGDIKLFAITRLIRDYHIKGFGNSKREAELLKTIIKKYETKLIEKPSYIQYLNNVKADLESYNFELDEYAIDTKLINHLGDTLTLKDIFNRSNKRIKVIDFWASWCPPCITQIETNIAFKDRLQVENNVEWIHLSIDKDYDQWLKKSKELNSVLNFSNSFYVENGKNSALGKSLNVSLIPRFVILNQQNKIVLNNAPMPSDNIVFENIIDGIKPNN